MKNKNHTDKTRKNDRFPKGRKSGRGFHGIQHQEKGDGVGAITEKDAKTDRETQGPQRGGKARKRRCPSNSRKKSSRKKKKAKPQKTPGSNRPKGTARVT